MYGAQARLRLVPPFEEVSDEDDDGRYDNTVVDLVPAWISHEQTEPFPRQSRAAAPQQPPIADLGRSLLPPAWPWYARIWKGERLMHFHRLIALSLAVNAAIVYLGITSGWWQLAPRATVAILSDLVLGNFAVAILIRQHYIINALFWLATRAPTSWPLPIRATLAKVYHFGGIHVGAAIAGTAWYLAMVAELVLSRSQLGAVFSLSTYAVVSCQAALLLTICVISRSKFRARRHDTFEIIKRLGGWASLVLFWAQTVLMAGDQLPSGTSLAAALIQAPQTWILALVTLSVALPWLRLEKVPVDITVPSNHVAIARFDYGVTPFAGSSTAISRSPLTEWHSFANIPSPGVEGFRLTISRAGDWTGKLIDDAPDHVWVKGIPTAGVANIEVLFKKVLYVATGSGIGPCVPHLLANKVPARLLWATRDPRKTYGEDLVEEILAVHSDAVIWDTEKFGKPDMVELSYRLARECGAEAVICISNKKLTWKVVAGMESRGIPAYGAIWDS